MIQWSQAHRDTLQELLTRLSAVTYVSRFDTYDRERFESVETRPARGGRTLVRTRLLNGSEVSATFDYLLESTDRGWRIVNVVANGVSDLSLKRAEYGSIISKEGVVELLERIERQVTDLLEEARISG